jgi:hypothetical protein
LGEAYTRSKSCPKKGKGRGKEISSYGVSSEWVIYWNSWVEIFPSRSKLVKFRSIVTYTTGGDSPLPMPGGEE